MKFPWVICLARDDAASLAGVRLVPSLEVAETPDLVWLRGPPCDDGFARSLAALPARGHFERVSDRRLRRIECRIPSEDLPPLSWVPLRQWLRPVLPAAALCAHAPRPVDLRLVRTSDELEGGLLLTSLEEWAAFAVRAPLVRLRRLHFAAGAGREVLVRGQPLPPVPGRRYVVHGSIAVPSGFHWQPRVGVGVLARRMGVADGTLAIWHEDGSMTRLHSEHFVQATRSAVRATYEALDAGPGWRPVDA